VEKSPYSTLGLPSTASAAEVKRAYFALVKKFHPDVQNSEETPGKSRKALTDTLQSDSAMDEHTLARFSKITEAYKLLSNPETRRAIDAALQQDNANASVSKESPLGSSESFRPSLYRDRINPLRAKEQRVFYRQRMMRGIFKVLVTTLFLGLFGLFLAVALGLNPAKNLLGTFFFQPFLFALSGFFFALPRQFDLHSFLSARRYSFFQFLRILVFGATIVYVALLFVATR